MDPRPRDLSTAHTPNERRELFFTRVHRAVIDVVWEQLQQHVQGAELEHLLVPVLESVYGVGTEHVEAVGGRGEKGADIIVHARGPQGLRFRTAIQVKMHDGTQHDDHAVTQLRRAHHERGARAGVLLTTAVEISPDLQAKLTQLSGELDIDIQAWTRDEVVRLVLGHVLDARVEA